MKTSRKIAAGLMTLVGISVMAFVLKSTVLGGPVVAKDLSTSTQEQTSNTQQSAVPALHVSIATLAQNKAGNLHALGTVSAVDQVKVFPGTNGQISAVHVKEGDVVKTGDVLFELAGINGTKHQIKSQLELAETNYKNAQKGLSATAAGNKVAMETSKIQLENAQKQVDATGIDLNVFNRNIDAGQSGLSIAQSSLDATRYTNAQNLMKAQYGLNTLQDGIQSLQSQRDQALQAVYSQISMTSDPVEQAKLYAQMNKTGSDFDAKIKDLNTQLNTAQYGYEAAKAGAQLSENQLLAQMNQSQAQVDVLNMTRDSSATKLGYDGTTSDPLRLAQEGLEATKVKNNAATIQAQSQVDLAKINLEMAKNQQELLVVRAPTDGIVGELIPHQGDVVSTQTSLTQIVNPEQFVLKIAVNANDALKITQNSTAQVMISGKYIPVAIKSVSPTADASSKLVTVTLTLPHVFFRANQNLDAQLSLDSNIDPRTGSIIFVPLDALIIGTQEKYVYVYDNGIARKVNVKVGQIQGDQAEVLEGLKEGDQVILEGAKDLLDGQSVTLD